METSNMRIEELKSRSKHCCCKYCGGRLELRRILYGSLDNARIEIFCSNCDRIEYGVEKEIYQAARYFVEEMDFNAYRELDYSERTKQMNIAKVCEIITWGCKNLNLLGAEGFKYPIEISKDIEGNILRISDESLTEIIKNEVE